MMQEAVHIVIYGGLGFQPLVGLGKLWRSRMFSEKSLHIKSKRGGVSLHLPDSVSMEKVRECPVTAHSPRPELSK